MSETSDPSPLLDPTLAAEGTRFVDCRWVAETGSTNADLLHDAATGPALLVADHQTAGRGRRDRVWEAPPGENLLMSIRLQPSGLGLENPADWGRIGSALAVSAVEAIGALGIDVGAKWPNDIVTVAARASVLAPAGTRDHVPPDLKIGGMLAEAAGSTLVLGLGLNVGWPKSLGPISAAGTATGSEATLLADAGDAGAGTAGAASLAMLGYRGGRQTVLRHLLGAFDRWLDRIDDADGLRAAYTDCCCTLGRLVRVERAKESPLVGRASSLTAAGLLVITDAGGATHEVAVGDVVHLRPA